MTDGPVLLTVEPARTAKLPALPKPTDPGAAAAGLALITTTANPKTTTKKLPGK
jgi:hypothetical protein